MEEDEPIIHREEAVGIMFAIANIDTTLIRIERLLKDDGEEEEAE